MRESSEGSEGLGSGVRVPLGRDFRLYMAGRAVSTVGDRVALIALVFLIIRVSHSFAPALALFYICRVLPVLLGGVPIGVVVDRRDRRSLMIGSDLSRAALLLLVPVFSLVSIWTVYPLVFVLYGLTLIFDAAATAGLPDLVPEERLTGANAILQGIDAAGDLAYAIGGALVFALGSALPFYIDGATFAFSALMVASMHMPSKVREARVDIRATVQEVRQGFAYLFGHPFLKWTTVLFAVAPFAGGVAYVLAPLYAAHTLAHSGGLVGALHSGALRFSLLEVALGLGLLAGSGLVSRLARRYPRGFLFGTGVAVTGVSYAFLALVSNFYVAAGLIFINGIGNGLFLVSGITLVQSITPSELRGRVVAGRMTVINGSVALGSAAGGFLLLRLSYHLLWFELGALIALSSLLVWMNPRVRSQY